METVLEAREVIIRFYKRYETVIIIVLKFIMGAVIFSLIGGIGRSMPMLGKLASVSGRLPYIALMSLIFAVTPINAGYLLITLNLCLQTSAVLEVALIIGVFLLAVQGLYTRLAPRECSLILAMLAAYYFKLPYLVPIIAGLYFSLTGIIPVAIATFIWQFLPVVMGMFTSGADTVLSVGGLTEAYQTTYSQIVSAVAGGHDWVICSFIYAMVVLLVFTVSRAAIDYSKDIAIGLGGLITVVGFTVAILIVRVDVGFLGMLFSAIISTVLAYAVRFFDVLLDYSGVERVQFQDEENVYYVKIVPKLLLTERESPSIRVVKAEEARPPVRTEREPRTPSDRVRPERAEGPRPEPRQNPDWSKRWEQIERDRERDATR